jgi:pilus assembly protein CpaB
MRHRLFIILAIASLAGLLASYLVYTVVRQLQATAPEPGNAPVVVATVNMGLAETITKDHVKVVLWPKASIPPGAITSVQQAEGRVVRSSILAGEPLLDGKLASELSGRGGIMPMLVPEGQRAVTIRVDDAIRETGFILPNSRVDVLVSMPGVTGGGERIAKTILQDVQVLASGQAVELRDNKPVQMTTVTLALTPDKVERLTLAQTEGRLFLVTRNLKDKALVQTSGATKSTVLTDGAPAAARPRVVAEPVRRRPVTVAAAPLPPPSPEAITVTVFRGTKASEHRFVRKGSDSWVERGAEPVH